MATGDQFSQFEFLMVFLLQNTQKRDTTAIQIKLDELIRATENARDAMLNVEDLTEEQLFRLKDAFARLADAPGEQNEVEGGGSGAERV